MLPIQLETIARAALAGWVFEPVDDVRRVNAGMREDGGNRRHWARGKVVPYRKVQLRFPDGRLLIDWEFDDEYEAAVWALAYMERRVAPSCLPKSTAFVLKPENEQ